MHINTDSEIPQAVDDVSSSQPFVQVEQAMTQPEAENTSCTYCTINKTYFVAASFSKVQRCCKTMQLRKRWMDIGFTLIFTCSTFITSLFLKRKTLQDFLLYLFLKLFDFLGVLLGFGLFLLNLSTELSVLFGQLDDLGGSHVPRKPRST